MAFDLVDKNAGEIAQWLLDSARAGKGTSMKMLVELAERDLDAEATLTIGPLRSLALRLANETQVPREPQKDAVDSEANAQRFEPA
jgi:hypothetical protein